MKKNSPKRIRVNICLHPKILKTIDRIANDSQMSRSGLIEFMFLSLAQDSGLMMSVASAVGALEKKTGKKLSDNL